MRLGIILYYLLWPLVWFYAPLIVRVRVILIVGDEVLVVKNWFGPNTWQLPGGGMKFGETALLTAAREIQEELGVILVESDTKLLTEEPITERKGGLLFRNAYVLSRLDKKSELTTKREIAATKWIPSREVVLPDEVAKHLTPLG